MPMIKLDIKKINYFITPYRSIFRSIFYFYFNNKDNFFEKLLI